MKKAIITILILLVIILGLLWYLKKDEVKIGEVEVGERLQITFLDIGQGDATFIEFPDGQQMLVDCAIDGRIIEALGRVMEFYDHDLDYLLITHPDLDHYGGCTEVLHRFDVKNIIYNGWEKDYVDFWVEFWQAIQDEKSKYIEIDQEDSWEIASTSLHFLYPDHAIRKNPNIPGHDKETGANNASIVFELNYAGVEIMLTGDAEAELEEYLLATYGEQLDTDILKASHHGSGGASHQEFVDIASPLHTTISCGRDNNYGHPSRRVLKRLERASSTVWRTDWQGDIVVEIGDKGEIKMPQF